MRVSELVSDLQALRSSLAQELNAINYYEPMIDQLAHEEARSLIKKIADTSKERVAALNQVIASLDPKQRDANQQQAN